MKQKSNTAHPWSVNAAELFKIYDSSRKGLSHTEAKDRLLTYGPNEIAQKGARPPILILLDQFTNPLVFVLVIASLIAFLLGETTDAIIIVVIVMINAILGFTQELKAEKTINSLKKLVSRTATVLRNGKKTQIDAAHLVPGDIVYLRIGDIVPADIRLLDTEELTINESALTGESAPVHKTIEAVTAAKTLPQYLKNMAFMGTNVMSGEAMGIVTGTATNTEFGKSAKYLKEPDQVSDFEKGITGFSRLLLKVILIMTFFIFIVNAVLQHGWLESFLFALALAVGITPEALPIIITISLSGAAKKMAQDKIIVKKLAYIEDLGNMDILCTDKTGTLTEGKLTLEHFVNADDTADEQVLIYGLLCNDAVVSKNKVEGNIIDRAIWESAHKNKVLKKFNEYKILDHNEFDFERRRMSAVVQAPDGKKYLIVKGALESLEKISDLIRIGGSAAPLKNMHSAHLSAVNKYRSQGYSTISIAYKEWGGGRSTKEDEKDLTVIGFLAFLDPPRKDIKKTLKAMENLGVQIKVLSGDDPLVTETICKKVGLKILGKIYTGEELDRLNDKEFKKVVEENNVFSRIAPAHKYRIVQTLNTGSNRTVAFMGDGINDAPAIKAADVGISVNTATDIAKEAADIILLDKNLKVLIDGIISGRKVFTNITKYILNTVSANFGNMFTVAASSMFLPLIPMLPSQILLNNLITDTPMMGIATDNIDAEQLKKPKKLDVKMIRSFMGFFGLLSTFFDLSLILLLIFFFKAGPELFRSAWFMESALSEVIVTFAIRSKKPFYQSRPGTMLTLISVGIVIVLFALIYLPIGSFFGFVPVGGNIMLLILGIVYAYFAAAEIIKRYFFKKFEF